MKEADIEKYLVKGTKALGGEVRKVQWVGRRNAPDRLVLLPDPGPGRGVFNNAWWVEVKHPDTGHLFPMNAHERAQEREHERMRALGQRVVVLWTKAQVEQLLQWGGDGEAWL